jgi:hypothetical protein
MSAEEKKEFGFPIYEDPVKRKIFDATGDEDQKGEWQPMNKPAEWLCKCLEGLHDIQGQIEHLNAVQSPKKRRRRLRGIIVPLHSLCVGIVDLINSIQLEKSIHSSLPANCTKELTQLREKFEALVPFRGKGRLGMLRNKVSLAHYDKDLSPAEMRELLKDVTPAEVGEWVHLCLGTLCDLIKLNAYRWSTEPPAENTAVILCETDIPVMSVVDVDVQQHRITGLRSIFLTTSPRATIFEIIKETATISDSLFEEGGKYRFRINGFHEDAPNVGWSAVLRTT